MYFKDELHSIHTDVKCGGLSERDLKICLSLFLCRNRDKDKHVFKKT